MRKSVRELSSPERLAFAGYLGMIVLTAAVVTFIVSWINAVCF